MITISEPIIGKKEIEAVIKVLESKRLVQGPKVKELEAEFTKVAKSKYAIATNSGTAALHCALYVLGIKPGDEVITTPFTFVATANSILMVGAKPVFVDINQHTFNIDPDLIEKKINKKTKAILAVDLYGQPADYNKINKIAQSHGLYVIEDAAQSVGATYFGKPAGSLGDIASFSLYATKNVIAGEGGIITTQNREYNIKARYFRSHGQDENNKYDYVGLGFNYRMNEISAAIALEQLKRIKVVTEKRIEIAKVYNQEFKKIKGLIIPKTQEGVENVWHQYTIRISSDFKITRDELKRRLEKDGIEVKIFYPKPLYYFRHLKTEIPEECPITEKVVDEVLSIPIHPMLTKREIYYIIDKIKTYGK